MSNNENKPRISGKVYAIKASDDAGPPEKTPADQPTDSVTSTKPEGYQNETAVTSDASSTAPADIPSSGLRDTASETPDTREPQPPGAVGATGTRGYENRGTDGPNGSDGTKISRIVGTIPTATRGGAENPATGTNVKPIPTPVSSSDFPATTPPSSDLANSFEPPTRAPHFANTPIPPEKKPGEGSYHSDKPPIIEGPPPHDRGVNDGKPRRSHPTWRGIIAVVVVASLLTLAAGWALGRFTGNSLLPSSGAQIATQAPVVQATKSSATDWVTVAEKVQPAVVAIQVRSGGSTSSGSGVIFDTSGRIITNYHVISSAVQGTAELLVQLSDGQIVGAKVLGSDATTDLAVLEMENPPRNLTMVSLGDSGQLQVGQPVAAIGAPLGLDNTMTTGIISALDRPVTVTQSKGPEDSPGFMQQSSEQVVTNAIQVDAAINPGNSGGPLFSADGTVIGINSSIASMGNSADSSGSIGIGFAIPVNLAKNVADQIISTGEAKHAYLGVRVSTGTATIDRTTKSGAEVMQVMPDNAAADAGLRTGDVVLAIDSHRVTSGTSLTGYVRWYVPGDKVTLKVARGGKTVEIEATLGATP